MSNPRHSTPHGPSFVCVSQKGDTPYMLHMLHMLHKNFQRLLTSKTS